MRKSKISPEMRLFSPDGSRLYLNAQERKRSLKAAKQEAPENQMFCQVLHYTGNETGSE
jgi:integrase/recombinase XerD